jgi:Domain of unknown function (DUF4383)
MNLNPRHFALVFGALYAVVGLLGFVPGATAAPGADHPPLMVGAGYGDLLGLFPVNALHNVVHLAIGLAGLAASARYGSAVLYARALAVVYARRTLMWR